MFTTIFSGFSLRLAFAGLTSFLTALFIGPQVIRNLQERQIGQTIREEGVQEHKKKAGVPTMGGMIILIPAVLTILLWTKANLFVGLTLLGMLGMGFLGMLDDATKVLKARSLGLTPRQKIIGQILVGLMISLGVAFQRTGAVAAAGTTIRLPFVGPFDLGVFFFPFAVFVMVAWTNAVNLTDGLDGLAGGTVGVALLPYLLIAAMTGIPMFAGFSGAGSIPGTEELAIVSIALVGGCLGFLWFNAHPAQVFMGDTGSMALGGAFGTIGLCTKTEFLQILIGGLFVAEALSVVLQVWYFKRTGGKRIFRMSPIHHHFELCGWAEEKVTARFLIIQILLATAGLSLYLRYVL
jgi:phospho-N-acetylmuramoyl-pentapeptide-transferase